MTYPYGIQPTNTDLGRQVAAILAGRNGTASANLGAPVDIVGGGTQFRNSEGDRFDLGGIGSAIIDVLSRGVYASANAAKSAVKQLQGDPDANNNIFNAAWRGLSGEEKTTYSDVIEEAVPDAPGWVKFTGGLAGDILLDPANLVAGGAIAAGRAGLKAAKAGKIAEREAIRAAEETAPRIAAARVRTLPLNRRANIESQGRIASKLDPLRRAFSPGYGYEDLVEIIRNSYDAAEASTIAFRKNLSRIHKAHGEQTIQDAHSAFRRGQIPGDSTTKAALDDLVPSWDRLFGERGASIVTPFLSSKDGVGILNKALKEKGTGFQFDISKGTRIGANGQGRLDPSLLLAQVKDFDVKNPLDFLDRANHAFVQVLANENFVQDAITKFGKTTPRPAYRRLTRTTSGTVLGPHLKGKNVYFHRDIAEQLTRLEDMLQQPKNFKDSKTKMGWVVNNLVAPVMNVWKPYMTIARPGHHVRNLYSDVIISTFDNVWSPGYYKKSARMLRQGHSIEKMGPEGLDQLERGRLITGGDKLSTVRLSGRNEDVSIDNMYKLGFRNGVFQHRHATEDFVDEELKKGGVVDKLVNNAYMRGMGTVAEQTNSFARGAHFIALMERKSFTRQFNSLEEAASAAAARVKKFHPDVNGLTPYERKNLRYLIPFYSWLRQTLPVVANTAISKPGRITGIPKIGYEAAKAMGINPESISDPFPEYGVYPSFVRENLIGPIANTGWGQLTVAGGSPTEAVFGGDLLNGNPIRNVLSMGNPLITAPVELATKTNISSGREIWNPADRIDQQIPVVNFLAKTSGYSPTSIIQKIVQGEAPVPTETSARHAGTMNLGLDVINFLTGLGVSDVKKSTYRNIARQELTQ